MEAAPPTYEQATVIDLWALVAEYVLDPRDLLSAALVCRQWHATFSPRIWGHPSSHLAACADAGREALTAFFATIQRAARVQLRGLTHTLHVPPSQRSDSELWAEPRAHWLRVAVERLPNLQSLIVRNSPSFDHGALQALAAFRAGAALDSASPPWALRLLDASQCLNATSRGLSEVLCGFENLIFLDLSSTPSAREKASLNALRGLRSLRVLKLCAVGLRDDDVPVLGTAIGFRVRSLDLRDNRLTDLGLRMLLGHCVMSDATQWNNRSMHASLGFDVGGVYSGEHFERALFLLLTHRFVDRLAIEDAQDSGVTHLYISGNFISAQGVFGLLRSSGFHILDIGTFWQNLKKPLPNTPAALLNSAASAAKISALRKILAENPMKTLTSLRIDHRIVTAVLFADTDSRQESAKADSASGLQHTSLVAETNLDPALLHQVTTLTLTGIPQFTWNTEIAQQIISFIRDCATHSSRAWREARSDYALPPGRCHTEASLRHSARRTFALEKLVLELAVMDSSARSSSWHRSDTMSVTAHHDSEASSSAARNDFSFFEARHDEHFSLFASPAEGDSRATTSTAVSTSESVQNGPKHQVVDTIALVSAFRKAKRLAFEQSLATGNLSPGIDDQNPEIEGYWSGVVQVVRPEVRDDSKR